MRKVSECLRKPKLFIIGFLPFATLGVTVDLSKADTIGAIKICPL